ncbi:MAG: hypothetical protein Q8P51_10045 [Ignavibacteria bacterium]|nr:hypothetical protein [Ignavibacteria bacterium]
MNYSAEKDIRTIFSGSIEKPLMDKFVQKLDKFLWAYPTRLVLRTRKEKNQPLAIAGSRYFGVFYPARQNATVFVGSMERDETGSLKPIIRFRNTNPLLASLPTECKFESRIRNWTCVHISEQVVDTLPLLMKTEADCLARVQYTDAQTNLSSVSTATSVPSSSSLYGWLAGVLVVVVAFLWLVTRQSPDQASTEKPPEIQIPQKPSETAAVPSKPPALIKEFHFLNTFRERVTASVYHAEQYGPGRIIVIFVPLQDGADANFHLLSLYSLQQVFGLHRGSFKLKDAYKLYDTYTGKRAVVWDITNPPQKFFCLPIIDTDTDKVVSLVVWLE